MRRLWWLVAWIGIGCVECAASAQSPAQQAQEPVGIVRSGPVTPFSPPAWYRLAWDRVRACSGVRPLKGHGFEDVRWMYYGPRGAAALFPDGRRAQVLGWNYADTVAIDSAYLNTPWLVEHELLHYLIQRRHRPSEMHPHALFAQCGLERVEDERPWGGPPVVRVDEGYVLLVENHGYPNVTIYDVSNGARIRLGEVVGFGRARLPFRPPLNGQFRVEVKQLAGGRWVSNVVPTGLGKTARLDVGNMLELSSLSIERER